MRRVCLILALLAVVAGAALAGPNVGVVLTPQGNVQCVETFGDICGQIQLPDACEDTDPNSCPDSGGVEWFLVLAAGHAPLSFTTITFGIGDYDPYACYLGSFGPCHADLGPLEISSDGWPGPLTGTSVSWAPNCLTGMLVAVYYFGFYVYYGGDSVPLGDFFPGQTAAVVSCDDPPSEEPIAGFGIMGCGDAPGQQFCPDGEGGACCVDMDGDDIPETCIPNVNETECFQVLGGSLWFPGMNCGPNNEPCPQPPVPTERSTWGRIKSVYR